MGDHVQENKHEKFLVNSKGMCRGDTHDPFDESTEVSMFEQVY